MCIVSSCFFLSASSQLGTIELLDGTTDLQYIGIFVENAFLRPDCILCVSLNNPRHYNMKKTLICYRQSPGSNCTDTVLYKDFDETPTRRKSITLTDIALNHIQQRPIDYGVELAQQSLAIATAAKSPRAVQRVRYLQQDLHPWRNMASAKALGKQISRFLAQ